MTGAAVPIDKDTPLRRIRAFRLMFTTRVASHAASLFLNIAVGWQIYELTGSALHLGLVGLVQFVPQVLLTLWAGQVADRYDRRIILRYCYLLQAVVTTGLLALSLVPDPWLPAIYTLLTLNAIGRAFEGPAIQALLPAMVPREVLGRAIAAQSASNKLAQLTAPPLAGVLLATFGTSIDYFGCLVFLACAAIAAFLLPEPLTKFRPSKGGWDEVLGGIRVIWRTPAILGTISLDLAATFFGGVTALLPIFAADILHVGPVGFGILRSAPGVGGLAMAIFLAHYPIRRAGGRILFAAMASYGLFTLLFGLSDHIVLSVLALIGVGASDIVNATVRHTFNQVNTPDEMRGRVGAVHAISVHTGGQLGQFESGITAEWFGPVGSVLFGGAAVLVVVGIWAWKFPDLRRMERPDEQVVPSTAPA